MAHGLDLNSALSCSIERSGVDLVVVIQNREAFDSPREAIQIIHLEDLCLLLILQFIRGFSMRRLSRRYIVEREEHLIARRNISSVKIQYPWS